MGVLTDWVIANKSEAEAVGKSIVPIKKWPGIDAKGIDQVKLATLWGILSGAPYQESWIEEMLPVYSASDEGPWVSVIPQGLVDGLASLEKQRFAEVARDWAQTEEFQEEKNLAQLTGEYLRRMCSLAKRAKKEGKSILMWMAL
jgi:hypothetical protein